MAAFETPPLEDLTAIMSGHTRPKPVFTQSLHSFRLVGPLHILHSVIVHADAYTSLALEYKYGLFRS